MLKQQLPGGVNLAVAYDPTQTPVSRTYTRASDNTVIASSGVVLNLADQWLTHTTAASTKRYTYDGFGRVSDVQDQTTGTGTCTWRRYGYNDRADRTSLTTTVSSAGGCADPSNPGSAAVSSVGYTYDSADRLVSETANGAGAWVYDPLGRITTAPVRGSPGARVTNVYYANDKVAQQTIAGVARESWKLDPLQRFGSYTQESWANGAWQQAVTKVNHYDSDSDSPAWIAEDTSLPSNVTRFVDGLDGNMALQTGKTGSRVLQLVDLHGDVMTTVPIQDGQTTPDWTALRQQASDEFGNATDLTTGRAVATNGAPPGKDGRYGWLGGKQRSSDALAGVVLMGARMYDPGTGRFWSVDPEPGGNATAYDYCSGDPVNCSDLDGNSFWSFVKKSVKVVAKVAEVASAVVPGPVGAGLSALSAGAYAATGNKKKALEMALFTGAALVGAGTAVAVAKWGGAALKVGRIAAHRAGDKLAIRAATAITKMAPKRAQKVASWLGNTRGPTSNPLGKWLGKRIMGNRETFGPGVRPLNSGKTVRVGISKTSKGKVVPAIRVGNTHYYLH